MSYDPQNAPDAIDSEPTEVEHVEYLIARTATRTRRSCATVSASS